LALLTEFQVSKGIRQTRSTEFVCVCVCVWGGGAWCFCYFMLLVWIHRTLRRYHVL